MHCDHDLQRLFSKLALWTVIFRKDFPCGSQMVKSSLADMRGDRHISCFSRLLGTLRMKHFDILVMMRASIKLTHMCNNIGVSYKNQQD